MDRVNVPENILFRPGIVNWMIIYYHVNMIDSERSKNASAKYCGPQCTLGYLQNGCG